LFVSFDIREAAGYISRDPRCFAAIVVEGYSSDDLKIPVYLHNGGFRCPQLLILAVVLVPIDYFRAETVSMLGERQGELVATARMASDYFQVPIVQCSVAQAAVDQRLKEIGHVIQPEDY